MHRTVYDKGGRNMFQAVSSDKEIKKVEDFIKGDYYNCPYFYTNLRKYGVVDGITKLFVKTEDGVLQIAALLYYDCLHVYFKNYDQINEELLDLIAMLKPRTIFFPSFPNSEVLNINGYTGKLDLIMGPQNYLDIDISMVKDAKLEDIPRIADFMYTHWSDIYDSAETICKQIQERMRDNYGRTKYIESEGEVVACVSSFAELDDFAVCGGLLVSGSQRGKKLGSVMLKAIYQELENEGKNACGIIVEDYSRIFHEKNGFSVIGNVVKYRKVIQ